MRAVALDGATPWGGVALVEMGADGPVAVGEAGLLLSGSHATHLLPLLDALIGEAGWRRGSVDLWVATRGPGSFTGLRVGLGTVRGLSLGSGRPCLGVGTLEAMAEAWGPAHAERVPMLVAGRGEVFAARYDPTGSPPVERAAPWMGRPERAVEGAGVLFGPGAVAHRERLRAAGHDGPLGQGPWSIAAGAGRLALLRLAGGWKGEDDGMSPLYLRPPDAEGMEAS
jgi:tRNA threonylcarbamoyladenosine biosynthesis protein TsaB